MYYIFYTCYTSPGKCCPPFLPVSRIQSRALIGEQTARRLTNAVLLGRVERAKQILGKHYLFCTFMVFRCCLFAVAYRIFRLLQPKPVVFTQYQFWLNPKRDWGIVRSCCRPGSSPDRSRKRRRCTALSMLATPTDTHKRHRARCQSGGRSSGSCPPQVVELIPSEVPEAFGSCRKFRHVPQVVGVGSGAGVRPWELIRCRNGELIHQNVQ